MSCLLTGIVFIFPKNVKYTAQFYWLTSKTACLHMRKKEQSRLYREQDYYGVYNLEYPPSLLTEFILNLSTASSCRNDLLYFALRYQTNYSHETNSFLYFVCNYCKETKIKIISIYLALPINISADMLIYEYHWFENKRLCLTKYSILPRLYWDRLNSM